MVDYVQEFNESFARVTEPERCDHFLNGFYQRFFAADKRVATKFANVNLARQKDMLRESLAEIFDFFLKHRSNPYLLTLSRIHGARGHDIPVEMYDTWLECLLATVREIDPASNDNVELAWRIVMSPGIEFMKFYRDR